jgi:hypothetical protein
MSPAAGTTHRREPMSEDALRAVRSFAEPDYASFTNFAKASA